MALEAAQVARFRQLARWTSILAGLAGVAYLLVYLVTSYVVLVVMTGTVWLFAGVTSAVPGLERQGRIGAGVALYCGSVLGTILMASLVLPAFYPVLMLAVILVAIVALMYATGALQRRLLQASAFTIVAGALICEFVQLFPPLPTGITVTIRLCSIVIIATMVMWLLWLFSSRLQTSLAEAQGANQALLASQSVLEERSAALQAALAQVQEREARLVDTLAALRASEAAIRELSVPVLPVSHDTLVMPLIGAFDTSRLAQVQEQALRKVELARARRLVIDITGVPVVDSQVAQGLLRAVQAVRLLGAEVTLVGIRPEVAQTIVGLGLDLSSLNTLSDLQGALLTRAVAMT